MSEQKSQDEITTRLKRVEGQIKGIRKMYEQEKGCFSLTQQIAAAKSALNNIAVLLLEKESTKCIKEDDEKRLSKVIKDLIKMS